MSRILRILIPAAVCGVLSATLPFWVIFLGALAGGGVGYFWPIFMYDEAAGFSAIAATVTYALVTGGLLAATRQP